MKNQRRRSVLDDRTILGQRFGFGKKRATFYAHYGAAHRPWLTGRRCHAALADAYFDTIAGEPCVDE
jgi:hypothetical protein